MDALLFPGLTPARHRHVRRFLSRSPLARRRFDECSEALGYDLEQAYADADIYDWEPYQCAFLAINLALADWARVEKGLRVEAVCGQSFGGFAGAVAAGCVPLGEMAALLARSTVVERAFFDALDEPLACVFFSRVDVDHVDELVARAEQPGGWAEVSVRADRGVHAVSGTVETIARLEAAVRARGGIVYYTINRAEHCRRMLPLRDRVEREAYAGVVFADPAVPVVSDVTGEVLRTADAVRTDLLAGWTHATVAETLYDGVSALGVRRLIVPGPPSAFRRHGGGRFEILAISPASVSEASR
ncbi:ACP S-malonyltransferase [Microbacterium sp. HMWF026]|uniref:ACP S-malonyltransferase n=1 Tax=Microbacterium sp. HMWF026 TaxID=2056861 RepID=UPI0011B1F18A|nr:ACP S-malonyltransferase [Microbacterium sp. HMWF026]